MRGGTWRWRAPGRPPAGRAPRSCDPGASSRPATSRRGSTSGCLMRCRSNPASRSYRLEKQEYSPASYRLTLLFAELSQKFSNFFTKVVSRWTFGRWGWNSKSQRCFEYPQRIQPYGHYTEKISRSLRRPDWKKQNDSLGNKQLFCQQILAIANQMRWEFYSVAGTASHPTGLDLMR